MPHTVQIGAAAACVGLNCAILCSTCAIYSSSSFQRASN